MNTVGDRLKILIDERKISVSQLSRMANIHEKTLYRKLDAGTFKAAEFFKICHILKIKPEEFWFNKGIETKKNTVESSGGPYVNIADLEHKVQLQEERIKHLEEQIRTKNELLEAKGEQIDLLKQSLNK